MTILSIRFKAACSALVAGVPGFGLFFALGVTGLGFIFISRFRFSSSLESFAMPMPIRKMCHLELTGLANRPQHAQALGTIVSISGRLEASLGWLLAFFSGGSAAITVPMFQAVVSTDAQRAMLEAAAEKALSGPELSEFNSLMEDFRPRYKERSRLVHNLWGHSNDHPDKAIWCPASDAATMMAKVAMSRNINEVLNDPGNHLSLKCTAYTVKDLEGVAQRLEAYAQRVGHFLFDLIANHPAAAEAASASQEPKREAELPLAGQGLDPDQTGQK